MASSASARRRSRTNSGSPSVTRWPSIMGTATTMPDTKLPIGDVPTVRLDQAATGDRGRIGVLRRKCELGGGRRGSRRAKYRRVVNSVGNAGRSPKSAGSDAASTASWRFFCVRARLDADDAAVVHVGDPVGERENAGVMGDDEHRGAARAHLRRISSITFRPVGGRARWSARRRPQAGIVDQRAGDGDPLLLAPGQHVRELVAPLAEAPPAPASCRRRAKQRFAGLHTLWFGAPC